MWRKQKIYCSSKMQKKDVLMESAINKRLKNYFDLNLKKSTQMSVIFNRMELRVLGT